MALTAEMSRHNLEVIKRALGTDKTFTVAEDIAVDILKEVAESVIEWMRGKEYTYKDRTFNLSDSVGCFIYHNGVMIAGPIASEVQASKPAVYTYHRVHYVVSGRQLLSEALNNPKIASISTYALGVYATIPYGLWVDQSLGDGGSDKRGKGWFSGPEGLEAFTIKEFIRIVNEHIRRK